MSLLDFFKNKKTPEIEFAELLAIFAKRYISGDSTQKVPDFILSEKGEKIPVDEYMASLITDKFNIKKASRHFHTSVDEFSGNLLECAMEEGHPKTAEKLLKLGMPFRVSFYLDSPPKIIDLLWDKGGKEYATQHRDSDNTPSLDNLHYWMSDSLEDDSLDRFKKLFEKCKEVDGGSIDWRKVDLVSLSNALYYRDDILSNNEVDSSVRLLAKEGAFNSRQTVKLRDGFEKRDLLSLLVVDDSLHPDKLKKILSNLTGKDTQEAFGHPLFVNGKQYRSLTDWIGQNGDPELKNVFKEFIQNNKKTISYPERHMRFLNNGQTGGERENINLARLTGTQR